MYSINFKIAFRNLWKHKGFSLINIGGLAVGLACCLMLLLYVNYEWNYDKQFKDADRIYYGQINLKVNGKIYTTYASPVKMAAAAKQEIPGIELAARMYNGNTGKLYSHENNSFKLDGINVDPSFLQIFNYHFIYGEAKTALAEPNSVVLTRKTAAKLFGNSNPLGQSVKWDNQRLLKVTGVIETPPENESLQFDLLQPWAFYEAIEPEAKDYGWGIIVCGTYFKVAANADIARADAALRKLIAGKQKGSGIEAFLFPLTEMHLHNQFENGKSVGGRIDQVRMFFILALCVLLIACVNYMNLSTARSEKRAREVGVRKALGASRKVLMGQFMMESLFLSFIAMLFAFALLELSLPYFNHLLDISIHINYSSYPFWLVLVSLVLLTGLLAGSYPSFYLSSFIPVKVLKGFTGMGRGSLPVRKILVIFQFTLSISMIICAIIVYAQIQYLKNKPLGFAQNNMAQIDIEGELTKPGKLDLLKSELLNKGTITSATEFASSFSASGHISGDVKWPGKAANDDAIIDYRSIGFHFSETAGVKIVSGRDFSSAFAIDTTASVLLNEAAVKMMNLKNAVGTQITWYGFKTPLTVVGVLQDYHNEAQGLKAKPTIYYYNIKESKVLLLRLNPGLSLHQSVADIKAISARINPAYPVNPEFIADNMEEKLDTEKLLSVLSNVFGGFAILISCLGLLGLALYMAEQRNKEISIRKVLGAGLSDILLLLNKDFMKLVLISNLIAFPLAYFIAFNWLKKYEYKVAMTAWPFIAAALMSLLIALVTVSMQSLKVAKANAVDALKGD